MEDTHTTHTLTEPNIHVALTHEPLDIPSTLNRIKSPKAGAIVLFAGTSPLPSLPSHYPSHPHILFHPH